jgi:hypothetical protein
MVLDEIMSNQFNDEDDELRKAKQQLESKQISLFFVLWGLGIFLVTFLVNGNIDSWGFLTGSVVTCWIAWILAKNL